MKICFAFFSLLFVLFPLQAQNEILVACQPGLGKYYPLIRAVYDRMGFTCSFSEMPSERAILQVNSGAADAEIGRVANLLARYPNIVYTTEPIIMTGLSGWVLSSEDPAVLVDKNLASYTIGTLLGNKAVDVFFSERNIKVEHIATLDGLALMLRSGRIQMAVFPDATESNLFESFAKKVDIGAPKYPVFHIFSANRRELASKWDQTLREMKRNGSYDLYVR